MYTFAPVKGTDYRYAKYFDYDFGDGRFGACRWWAFFFKPRACFAFLLYIVIILFCAH